MRTASSSFHYSVSGAWSRARSRFADESLQSFAIHLATPTRPRGARRLAHRSGIRARPEPWAPSCALSRCSSAWSRARTDDPFLFREVLYQLSYPSVRVMLSHRPGTFISLILGLVLVEEVLKIARVERRIPRPVYGVHKGADISPHENKRRDEEEEPEDDLPDEAPLRVAAHGNEDLVILLREPQVFFEKRLQFRIHFFPV